MEKTYLEVFRRLIPPLTGNLLKGECGKIGVLGGSQIYTGAPYFAAISALRMGADIAHIFCSTDAALAIKSYSPELIVHPCFSEREGAAAVVGDDVKRWIRVLDVIIVGPGLGRSCFISCFVESFLVEVLQQRIPLVIDADGLWFICNKKLRLLNTAVVLTPNIKEFRMLKDSFMNTSHSADPFTLKDDVEALCKSMGGVTILVKGSVDVISNGITTVECTHEGTFKRAAGQGDIVAGCIATALSWTKISSTINLVKHITVVSILGATTTVREAAKEAFKIRKRALSAIDIVDQIGSSFYKLFDKDDAATMN